MRYLIILSWLFLLSCGSHKKTVYVENYKPTDLNDALAYMEVSWPAKELQSFKNEEEKIARSKLHFGYGMYIRNAWVRHGDEKLTKYFSKLGIYHPDDISSIILTSFHRKLNHKRIRLHEQVRKYKNYWKPVIQREKDEMTKNFKKFKVGDTLEFKYLRTFVSEKQEQLHQSKLCNAKGILLKKRKGDFNLQIKLIESCDPEGINIIDFSNRVDSITIEKMKVNDVRWNFYNDWEPKQ